jgi:hypothetical protein
MALAPSRIDTGYFNPTPTITTPTTSPTSPLQPGSDNTGSLVPILGGRTGTTAASLPPTPPPTPPPTQPTPTPTGGGNYNPNGGGTTGTVGGSVGGSTGTTTGSTDPWTLYWSMGGPYNPNNPYPPPAGGGGTSIQQGPTGTGTTPPPPPPTVVQRPDTTITPVTAPTAAVGASRGSDLAPSFSLGPGDNSGSQPAGSANVDYSSLFNPTGYDGTTVGYDATTTDPLATYAYNPSTLFPTNPSATSSSTGTTTPGTSMTFPTGAQTLNQPMYPWLSPYNGNFTAPMTPYENQGLNAMSSFVGSGENLGGAQSYLGNVLSGQYLDPSTNPNLQKYIDSLSGIHDYQDNLERQRIGSSMAAGGNALSGARAMAESEYQNESNNQYQNTIAGLLNQNYQNERGLQNSAVPLQMGMSNELMGGYGSLMNAGGLPRSIQQNENNAEYADWLRQITGMQQAYQQPTQDMLSLLHSGYPGSSQMQYGPSAASTWESLLAGLLGGGGSGGSGGSGTGSLLGALGSALSSLFSPSTPAGGTPGSGDTNPYSTDYGTAAYNYGGPTGQDYGPYVDQYYNPDPNFNPMTGTESNP